jgi:dodecin
MAEPFRTEPATGSGGFSRLLGSRARAAAARDVEALLAAADRVTSVGADEIRAAAAEHEVDVARHLRTACRSLYRRYLEHCFVDRKLSDDEAADLAHLRSALRLDEDECAKVHAEVAKALYGTAIEEALGDMRLEPEEEAFLERLRSDLRLEEEAAGRALAEGTRRARNRFLATSSTGEGTIVAAREAVLELRGSSPESIEDAVRDALERATGVVPDVERVELVGTAARLVEGKVRAWDVTLRTVLPRSR